MEKLEVFGVGFLVILIVVLVIGTMILKGVALWRASRNDDKRWFWVMFVINSAGILPLIYIFIKDKKRNGKTKSKGASKN